MIYLPSDMKKKLRRLIIIGLGSLLALSSAALTYSVAIQSPEPGSNTGAALFLQTTGTPQPQGESEIGSTDGIVVMGGLIALIVVIPIFLRRKDWNRDTSP